MAYHAELAARIRAAIAATPGITERTMFGGVAFMLNGHMCCGVVGDELMVRVGADAYEAALREPYVRAMDFTGRPMKGMIYVSAKGIASDEALAEWVARSVAYAESRDPTP